MQPPTGQSTPTFSFSANTGKKRDDRFWRPLCLCGLLLGCLFFAASLTPSLLPRTEMVQGVLSGAAFAMGYGLGVFLRWLWHYMELPCAPDRWLNMGTWLAVVACALVCAAFSWQATAWQNSIRVRMQLPALGHTNSLKLAAVAILVALGWLMLGRLFMWISSRITHWLRRYTRRRLAGILGLFLTLFLFWSVANGVIFRAILKTTDASLAQMDRLLDPQVQPPDNAQAPGGENSLLHWEALGRRGREFIHGTTRQEDIARISPQRHAMQPLRVYVGLPAAATARQRARLALKELQRTGAFKRKYLLIVTPTGSGWVDPGAIRSIEYLTHGDIASVGAQYSYLLSWLSLLVEPEYGAQASQALFTEVYHYWRSLPEDGRPRLYLHGLSLGSLNSEQSAELFEILDAPYHGALWSGPTFSNAHWQYFTAHRDPQSPQWLPIFRDSAHVKFMAQGGKSFAPPESPSARTMRIVYLQYASDPVTFFDPRALFRQPDWMQPPQGSDVSPQLRWYPIVTFLQLAVDMALADTAPAGYGHVFAAQDYVDAWAAVLNLQEWDAENLLRVKKAINTMPRPAD